MVQPKRWPPEAAVPSAAGLVWLSCAGRFGTVGFLAALVPGCLLLAAGVSMFLYPGDRRIPQFAALGGLVGVLLGLPVLLFAGFVNGLILIVLSVGAYFTSGWFSVRQEPHVDHVPQPLPSLGLAAQVGVDEVILATLSIRNPMFPDPQRVRRDVHAARQLFNERGWLAQPETYHRTPPPLIAPTITPTTVGRIHFEHLAFPSEYEPLPEEPGRERWLGYNANRTAHAWVLRHSDRPRPWLVCIHGYEMGIPLLDFAAFRVRQLHHGHGLNMCVAVLPLHGPRRRGRRSGEGFLAGDFLDTIHAEAQAMWDIRRLLSWIRAQDGNPVGVYGLSLGGYTTALLACLDDRLACAIAGIPATDFARLMWRHGAQPQIRFAEHHGLVHDEVSEILGVISPLELAPKIPPERRYIFAGVADRLVPPDQPRDLWEHWGRPRIEWYQGAHVTFRAHPRVEQFRMQALRESGLVAA